MLLCLCLCVCVIRSGGDTDGSAPVWSPLLDVARDIIELSVTQWPVAQRVKDANVSD